MLELLSMKMLAVSHATPVMNYLVATSGCVRVIRVGVVVHPCVKEVVCMCVCVSVHACTCVCVCYKGK